MKEDKQVKSRKGKYIAPALVTSILLLCCAAYIVVCFLVPMGWIFKLIIGIIYLSLAGVCIYVFIERIKEIRSGEEDDLSQY